MYMSIRPNENMAAAGEERPSQVASACSGGDQRHGDASPATFSTSLQANVGDTATRSGTRRKRREMDCKKDSALQMSMLAANFCVPLQGQRKAAGSKIGRAHV